MTCARSLSGQRRHARGVALISALLIAAVVAGIAATLTRHQRFLIALASAQQETAAAGALVEALETIALTALAQDAALGAVDWPGEAWASTPVDAREGELAAHGVLEDLQGKFNLTNLAFDPASGPTEGGRRDGKDDENPGDGTPGVDVLRTVAASHGLVLGAASVAGKAGKRDLMPHEIAAARFLLLVKALGLEPSLVPAVLDFIDADQETRFPGGAEDDYYSARRDQPYRCANRRLADPSELLKIKGITPAIYAKLKPFVTTLDVATPVNVNTAPAEVLMSLSPALDRSTADALVQARAAQPWLDMASFLASPALAGRPVAPAALAVATSTFALRTRIDGAGQPKYFLSVLRRNGGRDLRVTRREQSYVAP